MLSISGSRLNNIRVLSKSNLDFEATWYFMAVVNSYKIVSSKTVGNSVKVYVEFDYFDVHKGNDFYFHKALNDNKIIVKYIVENGMLKNGRTPFTQTELYKNHLKKLIDLNHYEITRSGNNEFKRAHLIKVDEKYKNILLRLW